VAAICGFFYSEDGGDTFLRNVGSHGATSQKTAFFIVTAVKTSNLTKECVSYSSMSVCKKGLALESGIPVNLPLYPGECNPPRELAVGDKANWTSSALSTVCTLRRKCKTSVKGILDPRF
jgi:hypothetical protein